MDYGRTSLKDAGQCASSPLEVELNVQVQHVGECVVGHSSAGSLQSHKPKYFKLGTLHALLGYTTEIRTSPDNDQNMTCMPAVFTDMHIRISNSTTPD